MSEQTNMQILRETLCTYCGHQVEVSLRSAPEALIIGKLVKFDLVERFIIVRNKMYDFLVNMDDISMVKKEFLA